MSEKTYNKCENCRNYYNCDSAFDGDVACDRFKSDERTFFDRITACPEVLAEEFVEIMYNHLRGEYQSFSMLTYEFYEEREEAITATVAKLKEVEK